MIRAVASVVTALAFSPDLDVPVAASSLSRGARSIWPIGAAFVPHASLLGSCSL